LKPVAEVHTLESFIISEGIQKLRRPIVIGIDVNIWLFSVSNIYRTNHASAGSEPELRVIFYKLAFLASLPVIPVFIFDGPSRPTCKRNKKVVRNGHWLEERVKEFLKCWGFSWYTAAGEAEAELAQLNLHGAIDAVMTDDSDAFVFGARNQKKNIKARLDDNVVYVYRADAIKEHPTLGLDHNGFIQVAVLRGGDYDKGLSDCGISTAIAVAKYGLGDVLVQANLSDSPNTFDGWRRALREILSNDSKGYVGLKRRHLASHVPDGFPSPDVVNLYVSPATTAFPTLTISSIPAAMDVRELAFLCEHRFSFGRDIMALRRHLFPGFMMSILL
ncbi:PIN domain-like protein, partial [Schizopora paradoxa]